MVEVRFYDHVADHLLKFAVIISKFKGKWVFCKHRERDTYEIPGGHREESEMILEAAKRWTYPLIQPKLIAEAEQRGY